MEFERGIGIDAHVFDREKPCTRRSAVTFDAEWFTCLIVLLNNLIRLGDSHATAPIGQRWAIGVGGAPWKTADAGHESCGLERASSAQRAGLRHRPFSPKLPRSTRRAPRLPMAFGDLWWNPHGQARQYHLEDLALIFRWADLPSWAVERAKGIEPSTYSLGSMLVFNCIKHLAAKSQLTGANCMKGLVVNCKTWPGFWQPPYWSPRRWRRSPTLTTWLTPIQGNDPMSYIQDVIQRDRRSRMSCISIRMPAELIARLDAEIAQHGGSISQTVRDLLESALAAKHREK